MDVRDTRLNTSAAVTLAQTAADIGQALTQLREAALRAGGLCLTMIPLGDGTVQVVASTLAGVAASGRAENLFGSQASGVAESDTGKAIASAHDIKPLVEAALEDYRNLDVLQDNPLVGVLNLDRFRQPKDNPGIADGLALQRAIDAAMRAIERLPVKRAGRMAHYFRMRYVERSTQTEAAGSLDRSERTANRIKHDLIGHLARELLRQQVA